MRHTLLLMLLAFCQSCNEFALMAVLDPPRNVNVTDSPTQHGDFPAGAVYEARDRLVFDPDSRLARWAPFERTTSPDGQADIPLDAGTRFEVEEVIAKRGAFNAGYVIWTRVLNGPHAGERVDVGNLASSRHGGGGASGPSQFSEFGLVRVDGDFPPGAVYEAREWLHLQSPSYLVRPASSQQRSAAAREPRDFFEPGTRFQVEEVIYRSGALSHGFRIWSRVLSGSREAERVDLYGLAKLETGPHGTRRPVLSSRKSLVRVE